MTRARILALMTLAGVALLSASASLQKGGENETGPYDVAATWPLPFARPGYIQGSQGGVFAESPDRIYVLNRGEFKVPGKLPADWNSAWGSTGERATIPKPELRNCILVFNSSGTLLEAWTQWDWLFEGGRGPHHVKISPYDPERHVWVIDDNRQQVFEFTHDGKELVMTLGEAGVVGNDDRHFGRPTDIAWLPDGTFFVTDGYINTRVVKFDRTGKFLMTWGTKGSGPGQFNLPHAIDVDRNRRLYVADRMNGRVQVFDENGKFLYDWSFGVEPSDIHLIYIGADRTLWAFDRGTSKMLKYDLEGHFLYSWGTWGDFAGGFWGVHGFSVDQEGNFYVAEVDSGRVQKFAPRQGVNPNFLVGKQVYSAWQ